MGLFEKTLTADIQPADAGSLLDVNEKLHTLAPQLKERRPEDIAIALKLVEKYAGIVIEDTKSVDERFERLQSLLPGVEIERVKLVVGEVPASKIAENLASIVPIMKNAESLLVHCQKTMENMREKAEIVVIEIQALQLKSFKSSNLENIFKKVEKLGLRLCTEEMAVSYLNYYYMSHERGSSWEAQYVPIFDERSEFLASSPILQIRGLSEVGYNAVRKDTTLNAKIQFVFQL